MRVFLTFIGSSMLFYRQARGYSHRCLMNRDGRHLPNFSTMRSTSCGHDVHACMTAQYTRLPHADFAS